MSITLLLEPFMSFGSALADLVCRFPREASVVLAIANLAMLAYGILAARRSS